MTSHGPLSDPGAVVKLLVTTGRATQHRFNAALGDSCLRMRQVAALRELDAGPLSQQALAESLRLDPTKLVGLLNELEGDGLVERRRDPSDRRRHFVEATDAGRATLAAAMRLVEEFERGVVAGLDAKELRALRAALATVAANLDATIGCPAGHDDETTQTPLTAGATP